MYRMMYGRNGMDALNWFLFFVQLFLYLVSSFLSQPTLSRIVYTLAMALWFLLFFRMFSRKLGKRREENARFCRWWNPIRSRLLRKRDKEHKYFTCPNCKTVCRVPRGKGKIEITCPKCRSKIKGKS